jgi:hypothetical protein
MTKSSVVLGLILFALLSVPSVWAAEDKEEDQKLALDQVPAAVLKAAQDAVKGIMITEAEKETKGEAVVYELTGKVGEKEYEIKVSPDGKVLGVKEEKEDEGKEEKENKEDKDDKEG